MLGQSPRLLLKLIHSLTGRRGVFATVAALLLAAGIAGIAGCAGGSSSPVVLRVGPATIDKATVDHWTRAIALGSTVAGSLGRSSATPRQKALSFLISANWAIGAATEHGVAVSEQEVQRGLSERIDASPYGRSEFQQEIAATGQTLADVKLEVKAALALAKLGELVSRSVAPVTKAQIADYYKRHLQSFRIPDRRWVDLIEEIHGYSHAIALGRKLGAGRRFAKRGIREFVPRQTPYEDAHRENGRMVQTIFATPPGRVGGPVIFHDRWVLLVVRKLVPGSVKPLSRVSTEISERLSGERHARALRDFLGAYRREWSAKTRCATGFLVQKCSGYRGRLVPEGNLLAGD
jgi:hypothetical protein